MNYQFKTLVEEGRKGSREATETLMRKLHPLISAAASKYGYSEYEDMYQEACLNIVQCIRDFDPERGIPFLAYVKKKVYFGTYNMHRRKKEHISLNSSLGDDDGCTFLELLESPEAGPEEKAEDECSKELLVRGLNQLSPRQREVIELHFYKGHSLKDISLMRKVHYKTVLKLKARALDNLKKYLKLQGSI